MRLVAISVLAISILSGAALAQSQTAPTDPPATPVSDKEVICVDQNPAASTRVHAQRVCRTREE
jgi:hypothetical protein